MRVMGLVHVVVNNDTAETSHQQNNFIKSDSVYKVKVPISMHQSFICQVLRLVTIQAVLVLRMNPDSESQSVANPSTNFFIEPWTALSVTYRSHEGF